MKQITKAQKLVNCALTVFESAKEEVVKANSLVQNAIDFELEEIRKHKDSINESRYLIDKLSASITDKHKIISSNNELIKNLEQFTTTKKDTEGE
jgi:hypothetical protein